MGIMGIISDNDNEICDGCGQKIDKDEIYECVNCDNVYHYNCSDNGNCCSCGNPVEKKL